MKKIVGCVAALCMTCAAFALDISVGGEADFSHMFSVQKVGDEKRKTSTNVIGVHAFGDFQYALVSLGGNFSVGDVKMSMGSESDSAPIRTQYFTVKMLGKFPFSLGFVRLYPMAGFQFSFLTAAKYDGTKIDLDSEVKKEFNHYDFLLGLGADFNVTPHIFVRATPTFGIQMNTPESYKEAKRYADHMKVKSSYNAFFFNMGLGIGYTL